MIKAKNFLFYTGYVESGSWSCLAFKHAYGFGSIEEALQHFAECILLGLKEDRENKYISKCCIKEKEDSDNKYCNKCGTPLRTLEIDAEDIEILIRLFQTGDNDSIPHEFWKILDANNWELWGNSDKTDYRNITILGDYSEIIIARAAFGRIFDDKGAWPASKSDVKGTMNIPNGMKVFEDE